MSADWWCSEKVQKEDPKITPVTYQELSGTRVSRSGSESVLNDHPRITPPDMGLGRKVYSMASPSVFGSGSESVQNDNHEITPHDMGLGQKVYSRANPGVNENNRKHGGKSLPHRPLAAFDKPFRKMY